MRLGTQRFVALAAVLVAVAVAVDATQDQDLAKWHSFKAAHGKQFATASLESARFAVFRANLRIAEAMQELAGSSASFGGTKFMDLTPAEFRAKHLGRNASAARARQMFLESASLDRTVAFEAAPKAEPAFGDFVSLKSSHDMLKKIKELPRRSTRAVSPNLNKYPVVDWVTGPRKAVASVKDQAHCGSCWTFSAAESLEACMMLKNGDNKPLDVSTQFIIDCAPAKAGTGCDGGFEDEAIKWAVSRAVPTWSSYPYMEYKGYCQDAHGVAVPANTCDFVFVDGPEDPIAMALKFSPLSIGIAADALQYYDKGVLPEYLCDISENVDHAVQLVAFDGTNYKIKNSWGPGWGEGGFYRMPAGINCMAVNQYASYAYPKSV